MSDKKVIPNMSGKDRPLLLSDKLGYPTYVCDEEWETKLKKLYKEVPGGWVRR
jgi:hypothetical protein